MRIIVCGAGEVGGHLTEALSAAGNQLTVIDIDPTTLRDISDTMDVRTLEGNCADAEVLQQARAGEADLVVAATERDEINIMAASVAKAVGAKRAIARVHHRAFFEHRGIDYEAHFGIDKLICPEFSTAKAIARTLRNPAAMAIEHFSRGRIDMQEIVVTDRAPAAGRPLADVRFPRGSRLATISRDRTVMIPTAETMLKAGDRVVLVANADVFEPARKLLRREESGRIKVVVMGGPTMAVWLCRELRSREYSIRLFETNRERAEELAAKLDGVTVLNADPTDESVFAEEQIALADVFVALLDDDEDNIIGCVLAKANGVTTAVAVVQRAKYLDLLYHVGVDRPFSPGRVAALEVKELLDDRPVRKVATVAEGVDAYQVRVGAAETIAGRTLNQINVGGGWHIAALQRRDDVWVPGADDIVREGDSLLVVGTEGDDDTLKRLFVGG